MNGAIIIGGGPAGVTAAMYTARAGVPTTLIYKNLGALEKAHVDNFYGFAKPISGKALVERGLRQARKFGVKVVRGEVVSVSEEAGVFSVKTADGVFHASAVLLATGASRRTPKIARLAELEGRGVSYCAVCDAFFYRGKNVAVLGSGAYALQEAEDLLSVAGSVTLLTNGEVPSVSFPQAVTIRTEKLQEVVGENTVQGVLLENGEAVALSGLFIAMGIAGGTELARKMGVALDPQGAVVVDSQMRTSQEGLWAAGDCTGGMKQIVKAAYQGAEAGLGMVEFIKVKR
ncbi:MAG: NAD(P)/FAD-dependent oxidoreductase [Defluviitaleaceae bacterium]|nr:NAD(P)/FAD-dependent oxidoreductase [Defluviitaleaceae bacterium]